MRHPSYLDPSLADLLRQRIFQTASDYVDGNDANTLRRDPMFRVLRLFYARILYFWTMLMNPINSKKSKFNYLIVW